jgi:DNA-binding GntR family transcriptional regulator
LLADAADDPVLAPLLSSAAGSVHLLMLTVGRAADGMIVGSHRRLLAHLRAGNADEAALEMEKHLRGLHYMWRLTRRSA